MTKNHGANPESLPGVNPELQAFQLEEADEMKHPKLKETSQQDVRYGIYQVLARHANLTQQLFVAMAMKDCIDDITDGGGGNTKGAPKRASPISTSIKSTVRY